MRVSGGKWIRRTIITPAGLKTRPTSDSVRGAIFNTLNSLVGSLDDKIVLDAFAGSGALSWEALSRGARHVVMVEQNPSAFRALSDNLKKFESSQNATLKKGDVFRLDLSKTTNYPFDLAFFDPPYTISPEKVYRLMDCLSAEKILAHDAIIIYEHEASELPDPPSQFAQIKKKEYGSTHVTYLHHQGVSWPKL